MATLSALTTWVNGDVLTAAALNNEFANIRNDYNGNIQSVNLGTLTNTLTLTVATNAIALNLTSSATTQNALDLTADSLTTGRALDVNSNAADPGTRDLLRLLNDNTAATGCTLLRATQDANARTMILTSSATTVPVLDFETTLTTTSSVLNLGSCNSLTTGQAVTITSNSADPSSRNLMSITNVNTGATAATCLRLTQSANAQSMNIVSSQTSTNIVGISAATLTSGQAISCIDANALTSGNMLRLVSNSANATARSLIYVHNDNAAATQTIPLEIQQDAARYALFVQQNAAETAVQIAQTQSANGLYIDCQDGAYASTCLNVDCNRVANSAYNLILASSGNGADNEFRVRGDGEVYGDGAVYNTPAADYAEMFECADAQGIGPGFFVTYAGAQTDRIRPAGTADIDILGVVSAHPACLADAAWGRWSKKYLLDEFHGYVRDTNGNRCLNPDYDPDAVYVPRVERPEWVAVGMLGKLNVRTCEDITESYVDIADGGYAKNGERYRVIEVLRQYSNDPEGTGYGVVRIVFR